MARKPTQKKYYGTWNNPQDRGVDWNEFKRRLMLLPTYEFLVYSDEIGVKEKTPHFHFYVRFKTGCSFERMQELFPGCHYDFPKGTDKECDEYICKEGKWQNKDDDGNLLEAKAGERHHLRHERQGEIVENYYTSERKKFSADTVEIFTAINDLASQGKTALEIVEEMPTSIKYLYQVEKLCKMYDVKRKQEENKRLVHEAEEREKKRNAETVEAFNALCAEIGVGGVKRD